MTETVTSPSSKKSSSSKESRQSKDVAYIATPLYVPPDDSRNELLNELLDKMVQFETLFTDYQRGCDEGCGECERCMDRKRTVAAKLMEPDAMAFEVWRTEGGQPVDLVGILYFTEIREGQDATAHYVFFDGKLRNKDELLSEVIDWLFSDHGDWTSLNRITVEVPEYAFALARHVSKLGFGGPFTYERKGHEIEVEGVKRQTVLWRGEPRDLLVLGLLKEDWV